MGPAEQVGLGGQAGRVGISAWVVAAVLLAGAGRFAYSLTASSQGWSGQTYMELVYAIGDSPSVRATAGGAAASGGAERRWGPLFALMMRGATRLSPSATALRVSLRLLLTLVYGATVLLLYRLSLDAAPGASAVRRYALVFLCCQSTAAIYAIANGMGEGITAFGVVAHFYCFVRKRYALAAVLICGSIYFKLFPIVFLFPYVAFSLLSRDHRRYSLYVLMSLAGLAAIAVPVSGWTYGFFYPLSMVRDVLADPRVIPVRSKEVFGLFFLVERLTTSFAVAAPLPDPGAIRVLARVFTALLVVTTAASAVVLKKYERAWNDGAGKRRDALLVFQSAIGLAIVSCSLDVSVAHLLPIMVSLYAPLLLGLESAAAFVLFGAGMLLVGNLIPLSIVLHALPLAWLDRLAGNVPADLIPLEKFLWYQIPLAGVYCLGAAGLLHRCRDVKAWRRSPRARYSHVMRT
ncbi:MAG: hypothetical protein HY048_12740 [Acidobacteria bacterium]|nr:hypothetical protein [Acidobacteriota bacterium]